MKVYYAIWAAIKYIIWGLSPNALVRKNPDFNHKKPFVTTKGFLFIFFTSFIDLLVYNKHRFAGI